jgi:hypothetical protein
MSEQHDHDPLRPHAHDPNPDPPSPDAAFTLHDAAGNSRTIEVDDLRRLPGTAVPGCYIVSTGHGTSGPFTFGGVRLLDFVRRNVSTPWTEVEVISADGFGNRVLRQEMEKADPAGPILLALTINGKPMTREQGLVRMIVPSEQDDALRQVKWIGQIRVK